MSTISPNKVALITGGSSNLGISLAKRLIDNLPEDEKLTIITTSRTLPKALETIDNINSYAKEIKRSMSVEFDYILVDFGNMVSVLSAYYDLNKKYPKINYAFMNAVQTCYAGIDWVYATKDVLRGPVNAVTEAHMKIQRKGLKSHDGMGLMFQGNIFGPYYLIHRLKSQLKGGKIIWVSSSSCGPQYLSFDDLQMLENPYPYEGSKRLIDLMHMGTYKQLKKEGISQYVVNPGIFTSYGFFQYLNVFTFYGMLALFYLARFLGSTIHNITGYSAANSLMSCALKDDERQDVKVVSSTNVKGEEYIDYNEIDATGAEDVTAYLEKLCKEWDVNFKDQITNTRLP